MVPFAGYSMPLAYGTVGQGKSHVQWSTELALNIMQLPATTMLGPKLGYSMSDIWSRPSESVQLELKIVLRICVIASGVRPRHRS